MQFFSFFYPILLLSSVFCKSYLILMDFKSLHRQVQEMRQSFFDEGYLDCQYTQIEALRRDANHDFALEVITLYFRDSPNVIASLEHELEQEPVEVQKITKCILRLKSSSASIGAVKVNNELDKANTFLHAGYIEGIKAALRDIKKEHSELRAKFETYFQLMRQAGPIEPAVNSS